MRATQWMHFWSLCFDDVVLDDVIRHSPSSLVFYFSIREHSRRGHLAKPEIPMLYIERVERAMFLEYAPILHTIDNELRSIIMANYHSFVRNTCHFHLVLWRPDPYNVARPACVNITIHDCLIKLTWA